MKLEVKYFRKFARYTETLGNNAPLSDCTQLRRCIQGHLNYHLSSTSITLNGIDMLDASEHLRGPTGRSLVQLTLRDLLYRIMLESKAPLFLQLSQRPSGEVNAVIPNSPEAELMAERMNVQIAAWCHFYWKDTNPGAENFYRKLLVRAFSQVLLHKIADCTWDAALKAVISPNSRLEMAASAEFEQQNWVKQLTQNRGEHRPKKTHVNPNLVFPFQDDFSVGTIHGAKVTTPTQNMAEPTTTAEVLEIDNVDNNVSVLTTNTTSEKHTDSAVGRRVASCSNPTNGSTANPTQPRTVSGGSADPTGADPESGAAGEPGGK
jgi:hypothetical protein